MKKRILWILCVLLACSFTMTALAACGDEDDEEALANGVGEVCIVAVLPSNIAPYANLEVTYYDAQGMAKAFTVRNGETSDDMPAYAKSGLKLFELYGGFTVESSKSVIRTVKFAVPAGKKISCKYKVVMNGKALKSYPAKAYSPFAVATGKRANGDALVIQGSSSVSLKTLSSVEEFQNWLTVIKEKEEESFIEMN